MAKISGISYILIGIVVVGVSLYSNARTKTQSMTLFIIIGGLFLLVGIVKILLKLAKSKKEVKNRSGHQHHNNPQHRNIRTGPSQQAHGSQHPNHQARQQVHHGQVYSQHSQRHSMFPQHVTCRQCGAKNSIGSNFCMRCGHRFS